MALTVQTNLAALEAHRQLGKSSDAMTTSLERLSSGYRINKAADDAAGLSMSNKFVASIASMNVASQNVSQANSLFQIAEGGMGEISQILVRLKELATQAASANTASSNLTDINSEATALKSEIDRIANSTTFQGAALINGSFGTPGTQCVSINLGAIAGAYSFNTSQAGAAQYSVAYTANDVFTIKNLTTSVSQTQAVTSTAGVVNFSAVGISFNTSAGNVASTLAAAIATTMDGVVLSGTGGSGNTFQVGDVNNANYQIQFSIGGATTTILSVGGVDLSTATAAQSAMTAIDNAIAALNSSEAGIGAAMNRLGYAGANLGVAVENASAANSAIKDVDMASEMTNFTKNQILVQAGTAMLAQANASSQTILSLFK